jgi:hypothetical protein
MAATLFRARSPVLTLLLSLEDEPACDRVERYNALHVADIFPADDWQHSAAACESLEHKIDRMIRMHMDDIRFCDRSDPIGTAPVN